jgi:ribosome assembly protein 1
LVVDVVEGVCSQTEALLRQAIFNRVQVVLIINKMDRLVLELKMSEFEAFRHLNRLIENINSTLSQILQCQLIEEKDLEKFEETEKRFHFNPALGNVIFASAVHGYAFTLKDFAKLWATKLQLDENLLTEHLFSDSYLGGGKINPNAESKGRKSMFEQLVLAPLWEVQVKLLLIK